jgi:hypothetical protein
MLAWNGEAMKDGSDFARIRTDTASNVSTIRTSELGWLAKLTTAYSDRIEVTLIDDASVGINPANQSLLEMGIKGKLSPKGWTAVIIAAGMTIFGATVIILAIVDPDPTSKLGLLVASGAALTLGGGFTAIRILARQKPPNISFSLKGVGIRWD